MVNWCCVKGCLNKQVPTSDKTFYRIPQVISSRGIITADKKEKIERSAERRALWVDRINGPAFQVVDTTKNHYRICSDHFETGSPAPAHQRDHKDWAPTLCLGYPFVCPSYHDSGPFTKETEGTTGRSRALSGLVPQKRSRCRGLSGPVLPMTEKEALKEELSKAYAENLMLKLEIESRNKGLDISPETFTDPKDVKFFTGIDTVTLMVARDSSLANMSSDCAVYSVDGSHEPIALPDGTEVLLGRNPTTGITDKQVSRTHVKLRANYKRRNVEIEVLGNAIYVGDEADHIKKGAIIVIDDRTVVNLLPGKYYYKVRFTSDSPNKKGSPPSKGKGLAKETMSASPSKQKAITSFFGSKNRKRALDSDDNSTKDSAKKAKLDESDKEASNSSDDDNDDEHMRQVRERLKKMKEDLKSVKPEDKSDQPKVDRMKVSGSITGNRGPPAESTVWFERDTLLTCKTKGVQSSEKIAGFDIDGTLICTASGKVFPTHPGDWKILYSEVPGALKKLNKDGYKIVFFTNQMGIQKRKLTVNDFKKKAESIVQKLGVPVQICASKGAGPYRKPALGMWRYVVEEVNDGITVSMSESFYVGDAAGRPKDWAQGKKKDFSCSDRLFALNAGLKFLTPEEFFLKHKRAPFNMPPFDPRKLDAKMPLCNPSSSKLTSDSTEVVVLTGSPASGKSFFAKEYLVSKGFVHVNRDKLGTWQKCVAATESALSKGKSVVVDNTNPDTESRQRYTTVAKKRGVLCRSFYFSTGKDHARHNERYREITDKSHQAINDMVMNSYFSKEQKPTKAEGFSEIVEVNFVPKFPDKKLENLYRNFLLDK